MIYKINMPYLYLLVNNTSQWFQSFFYGHCNLYLGAKSSKMHNKVGGRDGVTITIFNRPGVAGAVLHTTMLLSDPPCSRLASTGPEVPRNMKKQPNAGRVDQL